MADLTGTSVAANYEQMNKGVNGLGPRTRILSLAKTSISEAEIVSVVKALTAGGTAGTDDAVVVAGYAATGANEVHVAVQGTGVLTAGANYRGVTGVTMSVVADFDQSTEGQA